MEIKEEYDCCSYVRIKWGVLKKMLYSKIDSLLSFTGQTCSIEKGNNSVI